eukprot:scaffold187400_cov33-Tisochrysis_lutea.AAC.4
MGMEETEGKRRKARRRSGAEEWRDHPPPEEAGRLAWERQSEATERSHSENEGECGVWERFVG